MSFEFSKLHGIGNDYVFVDTFTQKLSDDLPELARQISNRHFGVGSDGLILVSPSEQSAMKMRIFNSDGSEAQMCGNGLRCAVKFAYERGLISDTGDPEGELKKVLSRMGFSGKARALTVETNRAILTLAMVISDDNRVSQVCVNMDKPILSPAELPVRLPGENVVARPITVGDNKLRMTCVSMGNPHAVFFVDNIESVDLSVLGPAVENHEIFPERTNVHFVDVIDESRVRMMTWERGSGRTLACGTGASAVCVAGVLEKRTERAIQAELPGGILKLLWNEADDCVYMMGPAEETFRGEYLL